MKNMGDGRRIARVEREIQIVVAQYLSRGLKVPLPAIVTVAHVKMPADLRAAKVYISVMGDEKQQAKALEILQERAFEIQSFIGKELKMRFCPKLTFFLDQTTVEILRIEKLLSEIKKSED